MEPGDPGHPLRQPHPLEDLARLVLYLNVVVILRPVIPDEQHPAPPTIDNTDQQPAGAGQRPNGGVLTPTFGGHDIPAAIKDP